MSTSRTQNEITLEGSEIVFAKIKKAQSFTLSTFHRVFSGSPHLHLRNLNQRQNKYII